MEENVKFVKEARKAILGLARISRGLDDVPDDRGLSRKYYRIVDELLSRLEDEEFQMSSELKERTNVDEGLAEMFDKPQYHFPVPMGQRAQALYKKFEQSGWGGLAESAAIVGSDSSDEERPRKRSRVERQPRRASAHDAQEGTIKLPPPNHYIWGINGIMHGVALKFKPGDGTSGPRKTLLLDERYEHEKKNAKIHGHNGIEVGTWYPRQLVALFHGAHGNLQSGIVGDGESGAYSVVVSAQYEDLDEDHGSSLYYSGSGSHGNEDPRRIPDRTSGTEALHTSRRTGRKVRVLRSGSGNDSGRSQYAPTCGLRYDGLYRVVSVDTPKNSHGGLYEQFKLVRLDNQRNLEEFRLAVPSGKEMREFNEINQVNTTTWQTG